MNVLRTGLIICFATIFMVTAGEIAWGEANGDDPRPPFKRYGDVVHLRYDEAKRPDMVAIADAYRAQNQCSLQTPAAAALTRLIVAADNIAVTDGLKLRALSCFRPEDYQRGLFCHRPAGTPCEDPAERAKSSAPPGYSEHASGYTLDFVVRPVAGTKPVSCATDGGEPCEAQMAGTQIGKWLLANAGTYGFELSFPKGNAQKVKYEPWHWRWVGTTQPDGTLEPGAAMARDKFAAARRCFPASPGIDVAQSAAPSATSVDACLKAMQSTQ